MRIKDRYTSSLLTLSAIALLSGCTSTASQPQSGTTTCPEVRPEVCTMEYMPVCATHKDGTHKTYASGCTACANHEVISHRAGECN
ncbi:MAG TPA: hypothetical protein VIU36_09025 [Gammaproteobacteria bacterium]|jgi:hypothetical protein